jgi:uncharacterized membrane protein (UPF0127 family)
MVDAALARAENLANYDIADVAGKSYYVALTDDQRKSGLAGLAAVDKAGMVFVYDEPSSFPFDCSKMEFDLDIAFYGQDGNLIRAGSYSAGFHGPVFCHGYSYVIEVPAGSGYPETLDVAAMKKGKKASVGGKGVPAPGQDATQCLLDESADKTPYGNVTYADPGYQSDGKKRYPIDTEEHVRAAWSYINQGKNGSAYTSGQLASIKGRIKSAAKKFGIQISDS